MRCLGCDVIMHSTTVGDYCHACRKEIEIYNNGGEKLPPRPTAVANTPVVIDTWEGRRDWTHYRERSLCFGRRKPRIYVRPDILWGH